MRVDYQLASKSPIEHVSVLVDGVVVSTKGGPGVTLNDDGGQWFTAPAVGSHLLAVGATNAFGCERVASWFLPVVIK